METKWIKEKRSENCYFIHREPSEVEFGRVMYLSTLNRELQAIAWFQLSGEKHVSKHKRCWWNYRFLDSLDQCQKRWFTKPHFITSLMKLGKRFRQLYMKTERFQSLNGQEVNDLPNHSLFHFQLVRINSNLNEFQPQNLFSPSMEISFYSFPSFCPSRCFFSIFWRFKQEPKWKDLKSSQKIKQSSL